MHNAETTYTNINDSKGIPSHVLEDTTLNWFKVHWEGDYPGSSKANSCAANNCKTSSDGYCVCKTTVSDSVVFTDLTMTKNDILSQLFIGAPGIRTDSSPEFGVDYIALKVGNSIDANTVFEVKDFAGRTFFLKNVVSMVGLNGWEMTPRIYEAEEAAFQECSMRLLFVWTH